MLYPSLKKNLILFEEYVVCGVSIVEDSSCSESDDSAKVIGS
jgi:hypothetical protein